MIFLFLVATYYVAVVWLARRFKSKAWGKYWFWAVLVLGSVAPWIDQLLIRLVVIEQYCKTDAVRLGKHIYRPELLTVKASQVTWIDEAYLKKLREAKNSKLMKTKKVEDGYEIRHPMLYCKQGSTDGECAVSGYQAVAKERPIKFMGWTLAWETTAQLLRNQQVVVENTGYEWRGVWIFRFLMGQKVRMASEDLHCSSAANNADPISSLPTLKVEE